MISPDLSDRRLADIAATTRTRSWQRPQGLNSATGVKIRVFSSWTESRNNSLRPKFRRQAFLPVRSINEEGTDKNVCPTPWRRPQKNLIV